MDRSPRGRNLRKGRVSEVNRIYLVTAVTRKRLPIFGDLPSGRHLIRSLMKEQVPPPARGCPPRPGLGPS